MKDEGMVDSTIKIPPNMGGHGIAIDPKTGEAFQPTNSSTSSETITEPVFREIQPGDMVPALVARDLTALGDMAALTYIATAFSAVQNSLIKNIFSEDIQEDNDKIIENNAWSSAMQQAIGNNTSDYDNDTKINLPPSITLPDGTTSNLADYAEENDLNGYFIYDGASRFAMSINEYIEDSIPSSSIGGDYLEFMMNSADTTALAVGVSGSQTREENAAAFQEYLAQYSSFSISDSELGQPVDVPEYTVTGFNTAVVNDDPASVFARVINGYLDGSNTLSDVNDAYWTFMKSPPTAASIVTSFFTQTKDENIQVFQQALSEYSDYSIPDSAIGQPITINDTSTQMTYGQLQQVISSVIPNNTQTITSKMNTSVNNMQEIVSAMDTFFSNLTSLFNYFSGSAFANLIGK